MSEALAWESRTHLADPRWRSGIQPGEGWTGTQEAGPAPSAASDSAGEMAYLISFLELFCFLTRHEEYLTSVLYQLLDGTTAVLVPPPTGAVWVPVSACSDTIASTLQLHVNMVWMINLDFTGSYLSMSLTYFPGTCVGIAVWWHSGHTRPSNKNQDSALAFFSTGVSYSPGNKDAWTDAVIFSQIIVFFLVPYIALSIQVPSSEDNESNHDRVFSAPLKISFVVWF